MSSTEIGEHFDAWIDRLVKGGRFATRGDVLREGLRLLEERENARQAKLETLRALIREGDESGDAEPLDMKAIILEAKAARRKPA